MALYCYFIIFSFNVLLTSFYTFIALYGDTVIDEIGRAHV